MYEAFMDIALEEAKRALNEGNLPIGCCVALDGKVISRSHNTVDSAGSDLNHAEMNAIQSCAATLFQQKRSAILYSTLEPCAMCAGAFVAASIGTLVYAAEDSFVGAITTLKQQTYYDQRLNVIAGIKRSESQALLNEYVELNQARKHLFKPQSN